MPHPGPTTFYLVRHGTTSSTGKVLPGRAPGLHLSPQGESQAKATAASLAQLAPFGGCYVSPLERTRETARPIARATNQRSTIHKGLVECDFGEWTGRSLASLRKLKAWQTVQRTPSQFQFPGGESFRAMQQRMIETCNALAVAHPGERVILVSHADPIKALLVWAQGAHLDMFQRCVVSPCSVSVVMWSAPPVVLSVNTVPSLNTLTPS